MKIRSFRDLLNRVYSVRIKTEDWSQDDTRRMYQHGEPEIDLGGTFTTAPSAGVPVEFQLPTRLVKISSDMHKMHASFDLRDFADAKDRAIAWNIATIQKIEDVLTTLRALPVDFNSELVVNSGTGEFQAEEVKQV